MITRNTFVLLGSISFVLPACGDDTGGGTGGGSGAGTGGDASSTSAAAMSVSSADAAGTGGGSAVQCFDPSGDCTDAELQALEDHNECFEVSCGAETTAAYGPGWPDDPTGGACGSFQQCLAPCVSTNAAGEYCYDTACVQACGGPDAACSEAIQAVTSCSEAMCGASPAPCAG